MKDLRSEQSFHLPRYCWQRAVGVCRLVAMLVGAAALPAAADVVNLNNGDRLSGTVDSVTGGKVILETEYAGSVLIDMEAVASLETEKAFEVRTKGGGMAEGRFVMGPGGQILALADDQVEPIDLSSVRTARQNKLALTQLVAEWSTRADLSLEITNGNTETNKYNTLIETILKRERVSHAFSFLFSKEEANSETTVDQRDFDYLYKRFVSEKWYASGNAEYFKDQLKDIDYRLTTGAGMGYQFWDNSFGALSSDLGVSAVQEKRPEGKDVDPAIRWGLDYNRFLWSKRLELFHKHSLLIIPVSGRGEVLQTSTGLRLGVNSHIDTHFRVDVRYETDPPEDTKKTDTTYNLGIGLKL